MLQPRSIQSSLGLRDKILSLDFQRIMTFGKQTEKGTKPLKVIGAMLLIFLRMKAK